MCSLPEAQTCYSRHGRYEERIVELHSVIAELSRKLEDERDDVIREESEYEVGEEDDNDNSRSARRSLVNLLQ